MRILVTGGAGFIGSHLTDYHLQRGDDVVVLDDLSTGSDANLADALDSSRCQLIQTDLLQYPQLERLVSECQRVYHLAAVVGVQRVLDDPMRCMDVNIQGTRKVLDAVSACGQSIPTLIASSSEVYGFNRNPSFYENGSLVLHSADYERWSYAISKMVDETYAAIAFKRQSLPVVTVRLFNTIGPRQKGHYGMVVPNFIQRAVAGEPLKVFGDGTQTRAFCDVRDTVRALAILLETPSARGRIVNVGHHQELSIDALAKLVIERADSQSEIEHLSYAEAYGQDFKDIGHRAPDLNLLQELTEFEHQWSLTSSIDDLIKRARAAHPPSPTHSSTS